MRINLANGIVIMLINTLLFGPFTHLIFHGHLFIHQHQMQFLQIFLHFLNPLFPLSFSFHFLFFHPLFYYASRFLARSQGKLTNVWATAPIITQWWIWLFFTPVVAEGCFLFFSTSFCILLWLISCESVSSRLASVRNQFDFIICQVCGCNNDRVWWLWEMISLNHRAQRWRRLRFIIIYL